MACANVCPRFNTARRPCSRSSAPTTSALMRTLRSTSSASVAGSCARIGSMRSTIHASMLGSAITACFTHSARPERNSRTGSVASDSGSQITNAGCANEPMMFFASDPSGRARFTAVFPPTAASTMARSVVGTCTQAMPRMYVAAANPATSPTTPPPTATTAPARSIPSASMRSQRSPSVSSVFMSSDAFMEIRATRMPASRNERSTAAAADDSTAASQMMAIAEGRNPTAAIRSATWRTAPRATSTGYVEASVRTMID